MKPKIACILLVDDNQADNYYHQLIINQNGCAHKIMMVQTGEEALEFLQKELEKGIPLPELILLDINMPGINGWEFLEDLQNFPRGKVSPIRIIMLTTSPNPEDEEMAEASEFISGFYNKPLTSTKLEEIMERYFS